MDNLVYYAGRKALETIREEGLRPDRIITVAGAAGGPKWLVLRHLDRVLFSDWFKNRKQPLYLMGSSIGAWRFTCQCMADPLAAMADFETAYIYQSYASRPSPETVLQESIRIQQAFLHKRNVHEILEHPFLRLNFMSVRSRGPAASDNRLLLGACLMASALGNMISRSFLRLFFERTFFYDSRDIPPFFHLNGFPVHHVPLTPENLPQALLASGSIPLVVSGVKNIPGAPAGVYRDGGVIDYHLDLPLSGATEGLVLFPHYMERVIPGWLDKPLHWRKPGTRNMDSVLLVAPSRQFVDRLPYQKIPDRDDFQKFEGADACRFEYWRKVVDASRILADEFMESALSGRIRSRVRPWT